MKRIAGPLSTAVASLWLAACVTINVYFPAAAAESAADRILEEVYGRQPKTGDEPATKSPEPQSRTTVPIYVQVLQWVSTPANAQQADIDISTPAIQAITNSLAQRRPQLEPFFDAGAIGMGANGLIQVRELGAAPLKDRNRLRQLVSEDNDDWNALYREVAKANDHPEWEDEIRATFARRWVAKAKSGWWYQGAGGNWQQK